ncbi:MAG TPA: DUF4339 domain-containing protein [Verrucomicrobiae bacterium]|nr:DUF4339 domain-containing protein [Verrucomicrobiae bacterium]
MKYYIQRQLQEYGPYTLAELQRYVASGNILMTDLARSEGMTDWVPVSQVIGNIPVAVPPPLPPVPAAGGYVAPAGQVYGGQPANAYGVAPAPNVPAPGSGPIPPDFHWALVLLINFFCGFFGIVWLFVEAAFVKKISPTAKHMGFLIGSVVCIVIGYIGLIAASAATQGGGNENAAAAIAIVFFLLMIAGAVLYWVGVFQMRSAIENYYNTVEPINLRLSGVMTFFFALYYFQYHFSRINQWKKTGQLQPQ